MSVAVSVELQEDFGEAARLLAEAEIAMSKDAKNYEHLPRFEYARWENCQISLEHLNCYSFSLNLLACQFSLASEQEVIKRLTPGELNVRRLNRENPENIRVALKDFMEKGKAVSSELELAPYAGFVSQGVVDDGSRSLGFNLTPSEEGFPIALFFKSKNDMSPTEQSGEEEPYHDFHFFSLRRDRIGTPVWAYKIPGSRPQTASAQGIFQIAKQSGYSHFGGYFLRPNDFDA